MPLQNIKLLPEQYCVGDESIDKQHASIIHILNKVISRKKSFRSNPGLKIDDILNELFDYARTHFSFEEQMLRKTKYPQLKEHIELHRIFIENTKKALFSPNQEEFINHLADFLKDWFLNHINEMDRDAMAYVNRVRKITDEAMKK